MTEHTEDVEALATTIADACIEVGLSPRWCDDLTAALAPRLAARDAHLLAEVERERDEAREQGNKLADGLHVWRDQCEAAEAETARLRHDIEAAMTGDAHNPSIRSAVVLNESELRTAYERVRAVLAAERDPEAGEGRG